MDTIDDIDTIDDTIKNDEPYRLDKLPDEILRKIICMLPIDSFINIAQINKKITNLRLPHLLIPWGIEGICYRNDEAISPLVRHRYAKFNRKRGPLYTMYDTRAQLARIIGDFCIWDRYDTNRHDFIYRMLRAAAIPWYSLDDSLHLQERSRLVFDKIPKTYHREIMKSMTLRALL